MIWLRNPLSPALAASPPSVAAVAAPRPPCTACGDSPSRDAMACFISGVTSARIESIIEVAILFPCFLLVLVPMGCFSEKTSAFLLHIDAGCHREIPDSSRSYTVIQMFGHADASAVVTRRSTRNVKGGRGIPRIERARR